MAPGNTDSRLLKDMTEINALCLKASQQEETEKQNTWPELLHSLFPNNIKRR